MNVAEAHAAIEALPTDFGGGRAVNEPESQLTREMPHFWFRAVALATGITGYTYPPKRPLPDGTIYACGGYFPPIRDPSPPTDAEIREAEILNLERRLREIESRTELLERLIQEAREKIAAWEDELEDLLRKRLEITQEIDRKRGFTTLQVAVPEGGMEWLLHEVGHWIAATPTERLLPNYGYGQEEKGVGKAREWQAWAFEEIVLAPFGPSREFAPLSQRGGVAYSSSKPIPRIALHHVEKQLRDLPAVHVDEWRALYGAWISHELKTGEPSWIRTQ